MKLAQVTGTVTATAKDAQLIGAKMLICDLTDGHGNISEKLASLLIPLGLALAIKF